MDDSELTRLAEEELMREAKLGEARVAVHGVMAWLGDKTPRTNKRFLSTTISNALQHNHRQRSVGKSASDNDQVRDSRGKSSTKKVLKQKGLPSEKTDKILKQTHQCSVDSKSSKRTKLNKKDSSGSIHRTKYSDTVKEGSKFSNKISYVT